MTKNQVLELLFLDPALDSIIKKLTSNSDLKDDLKQDLFLILAEKDSEFLVEAHKQNFLIYYCIRIIKNQYHSSSSPFHRTYRKQKFDQIEDVELVEQEYDLLTDFKIEEILNLIDNKLDFVDGELLKMYYKLGDYNRYDGVKRDTSCNNVTSSLRKIHRKLKIVNSAGEPISISIQTIANSINRSKAILRSILERTDKK